MNAITHATAVLLLACVIGPMSAAAQQETRLIDLDPFDRLVLKQDLVELKLLPLEMKTRRPFAGLNLAADYKIRLRLLGRPEQQYQVEWKDVKEIELFEEMLLDKANELVAAKKFDEAYEYYQVLDERDSQFPGVKEGFANCLFQEAGFWNDKDQPAQALALLNEAHRRDPAHAGLERAMGLVVDKLVDKHFQAGRYAAVRELTGQLKSRFPNHEVVTRREQEVIAEANKSLTAARAALQEGRMAEAHQAAANAVDWWPELNGAADLFQEIHAKYSILAVGVQSLGGSHRDGPFNNWAELRDRRLLHLPLVEPTGYSADSGWEYGSKLADWKLAEDKLTFTVKDGIRWPGANRNVSAYDISLSILARANRRGGAAPVSPLARVVRSVQVRDGQQAEVMLRGALPRVESRFQFAVSPWERAGHGDPTGGLGPYRAEPREGGEVHCLANPDYFAFDAQQASEIVLRRIGSSAAAIQSLRSGQIVAFDRVPPWDVAKFSRLDDIAVQRYAAPTVHLLVPNLQNPLLADVAFRRAMAYGINRERILNERLLGDGSSGLGQLLSGPFPRGWAYDDDIEPLPHDPRMLLALSRSFGDGIAGTSSAAVPTLRLAHPPTEVARRACGAIRDHWQLDGVGLNVELIELTESELSGEWDLLYVECCAMDPLVDAETLLGSGGFAGGSPWLEHALQRLSQAEDFAAARRELHGIHRSVHDNMNVIPLWQLAEHAAFRKSLRGVGGSLLTLFENIPQWRHPIGETP